MNTNIPQDIYSEMILDLYRNPLNKKELTDFDVERHEYNPLCGDDILVRIKFDADGRVVDIGHQGQGCAISQAAASLLTDEIKGKTKKEILEMTEDQMLGLLGVEVSYSRKKCALLGYKATQGCITQ